MLMKMKSCDYLSRKYVHYGENKMKLTSKKLKELILEYMTYDVIKDEDMIVAEPYFSTEDARDFAADIIGAFQKRYNRFPTEKEFHKYGMIQGPVDETLLSMYRDMAQAREQK